MSDADYSTPIRDPYARRNIGAGIWFDLISTDDFSDSNKLMEETRIRMLSTPVDGILRLQLN